MIQTASKAMFCALACAFAAAQAGAQPYGDPYGYPARPDTYGPRRVVHCESNDWNRNFCPIPIRPNDRVTVVRRYSDRGCVPGRTFFTEPRGIWVDDGCRADFLVVSRRPMRPPAGYAGQRGRPYDRDRDDSGYGDRDRDDRYDTRPDPYAPRARDMPPPGPYDDNRYEGDRYEGDRYDDRGPPAARYDRDDPKRRGTVTVRDADQPQDRGQPMDDCDRDDGPQAEDCGAPPPDPNRR